jgi:sec-independent protein translocase protein TatA
MMGLGWLEILGILLIVILIFGVGRISKIRSELGHGIRNFRDGLANKQDETTEMTKK